MGRLLRQGHGPALGALAKHTLHDRQVHVGKVLRTPTDIYFLKEFPRNGAHCLFVFVYVAALTTHSSQGEHEVKHIKKDICCTSAKIKVISEERVQFEQIEILVLVHKII